MPLIAALGPGRRAPVQRNRRSASPRRRAASSSRITARRCRLHGSPSRRPAPCASPSTASPPRPVPATVKPWCSTSARDRAVRWKPTSSAGHRSSATPTASRSSPRVAEAHRRTDWR
ncbi:MAG: hypothetical protein MZW92_76885 [Comamonadaceae bacterium]|nr:hypothetical protein [Comamonadaceae bacterium]